MSTTLTCPFCYRSFKRRDMWFQCMGRDTVSSEACKPALDKARSRLAGFTAPSLPAFRADGDSFRLGPARRGFCPTCSGETRIRACPECHTRLPHQFGSSASPLVAMVGARGTGKSVYLTALVHELQSAEIRRTYQVDVHPTGDGSDGYASIAQLMQASIQLMFEQRQLLAATEQARRGLQQPLVLEWRSEQERRFRPPRLRTSYLSFYDTAGEDLTTLTSAHSLAYLGTASALILLLDPFMLPQAKERLGLPDKAIKSTKSTRDVLGVITEALRASGQTRGSMIDIPVAVAFAKMDAFYRVLGDTHPLRQPPDRSRGFAEDASLCTHHEVERLLEEWGGDDIITHLRLNYRSYRFFFVSALGAEPDYDTATITANKVSPDRVEEPLLWLLQGEGMLPRARR